MDPGNHSPRTPGDKTMSHCRESVPVTTQNLWIPINLRRFGQQQFFIGILDDLFKSGFTGSHRHIVCDNYRLSVHVT